MEHRFIINSELAVLRRLHPRRRIVGGTHRVTDPYGRDEALYKRAEPYVVTAVSFVYLKFSKILKITIPAATLTLSECFVPY